MSLNASSSEISLWSAADLAARFNAMRAANVGLPSVNNVSGLILSSALIFLEFFLAYAIICGVVDAYAAARLKDALIDAPVIRALSRMAQLKGMSFVVDRNLSSEEQCVPASYALLHPPENSAASLFPLLAVARGAQSPAEKLIASNIVPENTDVLLAAAARANGVRVPDAVARIPGLLPDRINRILGSSATCTKRCCALRGVLTRYVLLKLFFSHPLLTPITRFDAILTRFARTASLFKHLLAVIFAQVLLYSFYSRSVGVIDTTSFFTLDIGAYHFMGVLLTIFICEGLRLVMSTLIDAISNLAFQSRYPLVYAERIRRHAADMRAAIMTPEQLQAAVAAARAATALQLAGGKLVPADAEIEGGDGEGGGKAGDKEKDNASGLQDAAGRIDTPSESEHGAAARTSLLLQNPTDEYLFAVAAAPFFSSDEATRRLDALSSALTPHAGTAESGPVGFPVLADSQKDVFGSARDGADAGAKLNADETSIYVGSSKSAGAAESRAVNEAPSENHHIAKKDCCAPRVRLKALKDEAAVRAEDEEIRAAAEREEARAQKLWSIAEKSVNAARSARKRYHETTSAVVAGLRDYVEVIMNSTMALVILTAFCFLVVMWYIVVGFAKQTDTVFSDFASYFVFFQAGMFLLVEPLRVTLSVIFSLVLWPSLRVQIYRAPYCGRSIRRAIARASAQVKQGMGAAHSDPAAVRAAAVASHFPAAFAVFAYGGVLAFSSAASKAVDARIVAATTSSDAQVVSDAVQQRATDNAVAHAEEEADAMDAIDAAIAAGREPPPSPLAPLRGPSQTLHVQVLSSEDRVALANVEIMKEVAAMEVIEERRVASRRRADYVPTPPPEPEPVEEVESVFGSLARRLGISSRSGNARLTRQFSTRNLLSGLSLRTAVVAPAPASEEAAADAPMPSPQESPSTGSRRWAIASALAQTFNNTATSLSVGLMGLSRRTLTAPLSPNDLGGVSAFVQSADAGEGADAPSGDNAEEEALLNELTFDFGAHINEPLSTWRAAHPDAIAARLNGRHDITDDDCAYLRGVRILNIAGCTQLTDAAFAHLDALEILVMNGCALITDAGLARLPKLRKLLMKNCTGVTDAAFKSTPRLLQLDVDGCRQLTPAALDDLTELRIVSTSLCRADLKARAEQVMQEHGHAKRPARPVAVARAGGVSGAGTVRATAGPHPLRKTAAKPTFRRH
jgi:hypothetical protein